MYCWLPRSGTTYLQSFLAAHQEIFLILFFLEIHLGGEYLEWLHVKYNQD